MLRHILHIAGIEQQLQALKLRIEDQAQRLIKQGKSVAIQMAIAAALVFGAVVVALMAVGASLVTSYLWLEPLVGAVAAAGIVAGSLLLIAVVLGISAMLVVRREVAPLEPPKIIEPQPAPFPERVAVDERPRAPSSANFGQSGAFAELSGKPVSPHDVESLFAIAGQFARLPRTGVKPADNVIQAFAPHAEEATREAVARAANLVRYGDRSTVLGILGAAAAAGWILSRIAANK